MSDVGFIFTTPPYFDNYARDGFDMLLSIASYTDNIKVFFVEDAVLQLIKNQKANQIMYQDYLSKIRLLELYEIQQIFVCKDAINKRNLSRDCIYLIDDMKIVNQTIINNEIRLCKKILRF